MTDWRKVYTKLSQAGYSDAQIGNKAGCSRAVICKVRNGTWQFSHDPGHEGGQAVLALVEYARKQGYLEPEGESDE